jgi:hypothetical protein
LTYEDPRDIRKGTFVAKLLRPDWGLPDCQFTEVRQWPQTRTGYVNFIDRSKLPVEVLRTIPDPQGSTSYWLVSVRGGRVTFIKETEEMGQVFDEDGDVNADELADKLIDKCELELRTPDSHRFNGLNDDQWEAVKTLAHERINGRA